MMIESPSALGPMASSVRQEHLMSFISVETLPVRSFLKYNKQSRQTRRSIFLEKGFRQKCTTWIKGQKKRVSQLN